jgi:hypothetical protein
MNYKYSRGSYGVVDAMFTKAKPEDLDKKQRDDIDDDDFADPKHKKYPVRNQHELDSAVKLAGRSKDVSPGSIRSGIKRLAKKHGLTLPESWK